MNKVKFITSIYSNLYGTEFGGRPSRKSHYRWSLMSLLKMTNADFTCYTSKDEYAELYDFFHNQHNISKQQLNIVVFDLKENDTKEIINKWKNVETAKVSDRCVEIQYMKVYWFLREDLSYDYYYWIDAGLSHCGLIPNKYLTPGGQENRQYYESTLFSNTFLNNLIEISEDKFLMIGKENSRNYWDGTVNQIHYNNYNSSIHVIGGMFGGKKELWSKFVLWFTKYIYQVTEHDKRLYFEENIFSLMCQNHSEFFKLMEFDTWWHENERIAGLDILEHLKNNKSFYKILEEINNL